MKMKVRLITITFAVFALVGVLFVGCPNAFLAKGSTDAVGTLALRLLIPNYGDHQTASDGAKIISPATRIVKLILSWTAEGGGTVTDERETKVAGGVPAGLLYSEVSVAFTVPAGEYTSIEVQLLDGDVTPNVITTGTQTNVIVPDDETILINITCTPAAGYVTDLTVGTPLPEQQVAKDGMVFYKFNAAEGTGYDITVTPAGEGSQPDFYLFLPSGRRTGTLPGFDFEYTEGQATTITFIATEVGYHFIGVYGYAEKVEEGETGPTGPFSFDIGVTVNENPTAKPTPPPPPPPGEESPAKPFIRAAHNYMDLGDIDTAIEHLTLAVNADPNFLPAVFEYHALTTMKMAVDPDVVAVAQTVFGFEGYPNSMGELFGDDWLFPFPQDGTAEPVIDHMPWTGAWTGTDDLATFVTNYDGVWGGTTGDGFIDFDEWLIAFLTQFFTNNSGFNVLMDTALTELMQRLDLIVPDIRDIDDNVRMTFRYDTFGDATEMGGDSPWPTDDHGNPMDLTIGKAEILLLAASLEMMEAFMHLAMIYNYDFIAPTPDPTPSPGDPTPTPPFEDYWNVFNLIDGTVFDDPQIFPEFNPVQLLFLATRDDAQQTLDAAKAALLAGIDDFKLALNIILDRTDGFTLSPTGDAFGSSWDYVQTWIYFQLNLRDAIKASLTSVDNSVIAYIPLPTNGTDEYIALYADPLNWPDSAVLGEVIAVNFGALFANPIGGILDAQDNGEPRIFFYDPTATPPDYFKPAAAGDLEAGKYGFLRFPLNAPLDNAIENAPFDDPATQILHFDWTESGGTAKWDDGETITVYGLGPRVEGVIDLAEAASYTDSDPITYYYGLSETLTLTDVTDTELLLYTDDAAALRTALGLLTSTTEEGLPLIPFFKAGADSTPPTLFFADLMRITTVAGWHSLTAVDTAGPVSTIFEGQVSTGSAWWLLTNTGLQMFGSMLPTPAPTPTPTPTPTP